MSSIDLEASRLDAGNVTPVVFDELPRRKRACMDLSVDEEPHRSSPVNLRGRSIDDSRVSNSKKKRSGSYEGAQNTPQTGMTGYASAEVIENYNLIIKQIYKKVAPVKQRRVRRSRNHYRQKVAKAPKRKSVFADFSLFECLDYDDGFGYNEPSSEADGLADMFAKLSIQDSAPRPAYANVNTCGGRTRKVHEDLAMLVDNDEEDDADVFGGECQHITKRRCMM